MQERPLAALAALAAVTSPDLVRDAADRLKAFTRDEFERDPMEAALRTVVVGSLLFYAAERGKNPKVKTIHDALVFVTTNLSVGYCDIYATTPMGKSVASAVMTWGPALAARIFDPPAGAAPRDSTQAVVDRLDKILAAIEARA